MLSTFYEKISFALKNMVRADLFSGSLAVWNVRGGAALIFRPLNPSPPQAGEDRIPFELFLIYTASWEIRKPEEAASLRSAANLYSFLGENEKDLSIRAKEIFYQF